MFHLFYVLSSHLCFCINLIKESKDIFIRIFNISGSSSSTIYSTDIVVMAVATLFAIITGNNIAKS